MRKWINASNTEQCNLKRMGTLSGESHPLQSWSTLKGKKCSSWEQILALKSQFCFEKVLLKVKQIGSRSIL